MAKRFFRHGELHLVILALLSGRALNGYELMSELGRLFGPAYRPSPGSVYPAMKALASEGLIETDTEGSRHTATDTGRAAVADRLTDLARLEMRTGVSLGDRPGVHDEIEGVLERLGATVRAASERVAPEALVGAVEDCAHQVERLQRRTTEGMSGHG